MSRELKPSRIKKYGKHLAALIITIIETINPLSLDLNKESLLDIGLDKEGCNQGTLFILNITDFGNRACEEFIKELWKQPKKFWRKNKETKDT